MIQNKDHILVVKFPSAPGDSISVKIKKPSSLVFELVSLGSYVPVEGEEGYYNIPVNKSYLSEIGTYIFILEGYETQIEVKEECFPRPLNSSPMPDLCIIEGNVRNISGQSEFKTQPTITVRPLKLPLVNASNLLAGERTSTISNFEGYFSIPVIKNTTVLIEIKECGFRVQANIPNQDFVRLEDLIP